MYNSFNLYIDQLNYHDDLCDNYRNLYLINIIFTDGYIIILYIQIRTTTIIKNIIILFINIIKFRNKLDYISSNII